MKNIVNLGSMMLAILILAGCADIYRTSVFNHWSCEAEDARMDERGSTFAPRLKCRESFGNYRPGSRNHVEKIHHIVIECISQSLGEGHLVNIHHNGGLPNAMKISYGENGPERVVMDSDITDYGYISTYLDSRASLVTALQATTPVVYDLGRASPRRVVIARSSRTWIDTFVQMCDNHNDQFDK